MTAGRRPPSPFRSRLTGALPLMLTPLLGGCDWIVMNPAGDVAVQQRDLILISTGLMLLVILPVMALTVLFAWKYRDRARARDYDPDWDHSTGLELLIWSIPLLIIIALGAITWSSTHLLDPYRPIERIGPGQKVDPATKPILVDVVAMDWKWLFIYPELGVATVNELAAPVDRPIAFKLTSSSIMNSFYIPALAGQIYAMPGMQTQLHAVANRAGSYDGFSANYSGAGFSHMRFRFRALDPSGFDQWVARVRASGTMLDRAAYMTLEKPSEKVPPMLFGRVEPHLFHAALNMCVQPGKRCMDAVMMTDQRGGAGKESARDTDGLRHDGTIDFGSFHPMPPGAGSGKTPPSPTTQPVPTAPPAPTAQPVPAQPPSGGSTAAPGHDGHHGHHAK
ncbi:MAG: ubiquinol oxidase subunit II [Sphingobium sp.]